MIVIPAVDIRGGLCVRLRHGDPAQQTVYSEDPVGMARRWAADGAERLHVVDLDGAFGDGPSNLDLVFRIQEAVKIPVEMGGGLRSESAVRRVLDKGVARAILGTVLAGDVSWLPKVTRDFPGRVMAGLDTKDGQVMVRGWKEGSGLSLPDALRRLEDLGIDEIIFTDIRTDGALQGPNLAAVRDVMSRTRLGVIASGGVSSAADLRALAGIPGLRGAIVGKALYDGRVTVPDAIAATRGGAA